MIAKLLDTEDEATRVLALKCIGRLSHEAHVAEASAAEPKEVKRVLVMAAPILELHSTWGEPQVEITIYRILTPNLPF